MKRIKAPVDDGVHLALVEAGVPDANVVGAIQPLGDLDQLLVGLQLDIVVLEMQKKNYFSE